MKSRAELNSTLSEVIAITGANGLIKAWHQPGDDLVLIRVPANAPAAEEALAAIMSTAPSQGLRCRWAGPRLAAIGLPTSKD